MGSSYGDFVKYPRTPHLFGSHGTDDDKHLGEMESNRIISAPSLIVEEKIDGTNVGIHFGSDGQMVLQCRGHLITEGMHPQYDLFKQWISVKRSILEERLKNRYIMFGEWMYAKHSLHYRGLPHFFFEFDMYDKEAGVFLSLDLRTALLEDSNIQTVPVVHRGAIRKDQIVSLVGPSGFGARFENPITGRADNLMEGLYMRTESAGSVTARAKYVRYEFVEKIKQSTHWQHQALVPNMLKEGANIWL
ncbi:MAG: RNA ligase family protein [Patescibacteria group bacterium]|nr:RNA ligase family protein [Patescibacteria group bacterium]